MTNTVTFNRKVFVVRGGIRKQIPFALLEIGEEFELYEADDIFVGDYRTIDRPYQTDDGVWTVEVEDR